jgi:hypothetical protein
VIAAWCDDCQAMLVCEYKADVPEGVLVLVPCAVVGTRCYCQRCAGKVAPVICGFCRSETSNHLAGCPRWVSLVAQGEPGDDGGNDQGPDS